MSKKFPYVSATIQELLGEINDSEHNFTMYNTTIVLSNLSNEDKLILKISIPLIEQFGYKYWKSLKNNSNLSNENIEILERTIKINDFLTNE